MSDASVARAERAQQLLRAMVETGAHISKAHEGKGWTWLELKRWMFNRFFQTDPTIEKLLRQLEDYGSIKEINGKWYAVYPLSLKKTQKHRGP